MRTRRNLRTLRWIGSMLAGLLPVIAQGAQLELPYTAASRYNPAGQLTGTIAPDPDGSGQLGYPATRYIYGESGATRGLLLRVERGELSAWVDEMISVASWDGYGFAISVTTAYTYDSHGRKATERVIGTDGLTESLTQYSYDGWDRVQCKAVRMNQSAYGSLPGSACELGPEGPFGSDRISRYTYDHLDQVLTEQRAISTSVQQTYVTNTYAGRGVLTSQTDANGNRTELRYDANWRLKRRVYPSATASGVVNESDYNEYGYDKNGNVVFEHKRDSRTITNAYDNNNRLIFKDLSDNTFSPDISYDYDLRGLMRSARFDSDSGEGIDNGFDGFGRLTSATINMMGASRTLSYQYDANGNRTRVTHPDQQFFEYTFDSLDRLTGIGESTATSPTASASTLLTLDYHRAGGRWHILRPGGATTTYLQDNVKRLDSFTQDFPGTADDLTNAFDYNPASQVTFLTRSNDLYSLSGAVSRAGAYVPNGLNQYTSVAGRPIAHDNNGNLTNDGSLIYIYDSENRLLNTGGAVMANFTYDPLGRLFQVAIGSTIRQFLYDGDALVAEYSVSTMTRRYVHGDRVDEPLVQYNGSAVGSSSRRYLHADHQGSIIAQSDSTGVVLAKNVYDPYGIPGANNTGRFGYTGQIWLQELGLYHYKARIYHPTLGRFLQTDPIFYADAMNLYAYVSNDPLRGTDPTGEAEYRVLYGEPGLGEHNVGRNFQRAAETRAAELRAEGHNVTVTAVATVGEFNAAITTGTRIDGGVDYFGHGWQQSLYVGQSDGAETNVDASNIRELSGENLAESVTVTLSSCNAGMGGRYSIAQMMAAQLGVAVKGSDQPLGFTGEKGVYLHGEDARPPDSGPLYMTPPKEENWKTFQPR